MAKYQLLLNSDSVKREDGAYIPNNDHNKDWQEYQKWLSEGNTPDPVPLQIRIQNKMSELDNQLTFNKYKNISHNAKNYLADKNSQDLIADVLSTYERGFSEIFPADWIMADNSVLSQTYDEIKALSFAIATRTKLCYDHYKSLATQIATSQNPENINVTVGWAN